MAALDVPWSSPSASRLVHSSILVLWTDSYIWTIPSDHRHAYGYLRGSILRGVAFDVQAYCVPRVQDTSGCGSGLE